MRYSIAIVILTLSCTPETQARRKQIQAAEDAFCALRAKEKALEESGILDSSDAGILKH